jgi:guanosine-diphosphatase
MIDAGSTGSRIHVYKFNNCLASPTFEYEVFKQTRPGLSSYAGNPTQAAESLDPLLREAERVIPQKQWKCTPVAVKATAGLRLLGQEQSDAILEAVKSRLQARYEFSVVHKDGVVVMDGKDEGVFAWITANYLLNTLPSNPTTNANKDKESSSPYAVLDLGGASTQIVFKPLLDIDGDGVDDSHLEEGDHKYDLHFGGQTHVLYQHSYLGYGLMRARSSVHKVVEFVASFASRPQLPHDGNDNTPVEVPNPCIARGMSRTIEVDIGRSGEKVLKNVTMTGGDVGSWDACNRVLELVLAKDA